MHERIKYKWDHCAYQAQQKGHVMRHKLVVHEGVKYYCDLCDYKGTEQEIYDT